MPRTFTLLRTLGRGAHGAVHLAELRDDEDYVQTLAVKRLLPQWTADADLVARLKDEARLLALLRHDHVVRVHGLTRIEGALAILMEPVEGVDLATLVPTTGPLPPRVAVEVVEAVADALDAAWCTVPPGQSRPLHVVHRDIKPSNVMVTARGGVKVMDFGVARASFDAREVETRSQQYGTARYMAPERWLSGEAGHHSDVFALGVTLCEVASGHAFERPRLSPELFAEDVARATHGLPEALRQLVTAMTAFEVADRPDAAAVAERCRGLLSTLDGPPLRVWAASHVRPDPGAPVDPTATATVMEEVVTREPTPVAAQGEEPRRRVLPSWLPLAVTAALLAVPVLRRVGAEPVSPVVVAATPSPASVPTPEPVAVPVPEAEPVPLPAPEPSAPDPTPPSRPAPAPPSPPVPERPAREIHPTVKMRFLVDPGLVARTDLGVIRRSPAVLELPALSTVEVRVDEGGRTWTCNISVGSTPGTVRVRREADGRCQQQ